MRTFASILTAIVITLLAATPAVADTFGITSEIPFTGFLQAGKKPANGTHDLQFFLYDAPTSGTQIGSVSSAFGVPIKKGQYSTTVDFGAGVWTGAPRWMEVHFRKGNATTFTPSPDRIQVLAVSYAHTAAHAASADSITGTVNANHALTAEHAAYANHSDTATSSSFASLSAIALTARDADYSTTAGHATTADFATTATVALSSNALPDGAHVLVTTGTLPSGFTLGTGAIAAPGTWEVVPSNLNVISGSAFCSANGKLYRLGGNSPVATDEVYCYDFQNGLWEPKAPMLTARSESVRRSIAVVGKRLFVFGGNPVPNKNESYDTETNSWSTNADLPVNMSSVYAVTVGSDVHLFSSSSTHYVYHTASNSYSSRPETEHAADQDALVAVGTTIYIAKGGVLLAYDAPTGAVRRIHNFPEVSSGLAARGVAYKGDSLFLLTSDMGTFYEYALAEARWIKRQYPRYTASAYLAECNGELFSLGTGSYASPTLEKFIPGTDLYFIRKN